MIYLFLATCTVVICLCIEEEADRVIKTLKRNKK